MAKNKCAHLPCTCLVEEGETHCGPYCEDADNLSEITCHCAHAGCAVEVVAEGLELA